MFFSVFFIFYKKYIFPFMPSSFYFYVGGAFMLLCYTIRGL